MRIELVGSPGCGKTTLAKAFEKLGVKVSYENVTDNPYLSSAYIDDMYKLPSQLRFVTNKFDELSCMSVEDITVMDQGFATSHAFNRMLFNPGTAEYMAAALPMAVLENQVGHAEHTLYLKCNEEKQLNRIKTRGRGFERLTANFLQTLDKHIVEVLKDYPEHRVVDTSTWGLVDYEIFAKAFIEEIQQDTVGSLQKKSSVV